MLGKHFFGSLIAVLLIGVTPACASAWLGKMSDAPDFKSRSDVKPGEWRDVSVKAQPMIDREAMIENGQPAPPLAGKLKFLGGLVLTSPDEKFGGFSGLRFYPGENRLIALSDRAQWWESDITFDADGAATGLTNGRMSVVLSHENTALEDMAGDAEGVELVEGGVLASFERYHRIDAYKRGDDGSFSFRQRILHNRLVKGLNNNQSLESIARLQDGRVITFAEDPPSGSTDKSVPGWISYPANWEQGGDDWVPISLQPGEGFSVTEMAVDRSDAGNGMIYVLERGYSKLAGPRARLSRLSVDDLKPGTVISGEELGRLNIAYGIDNMEAMDLRRLDDGRLIVYLLSDNNFSINQRTVLLSFEVMD